MNKILFITLFSFILFRESKSLILIDDSRYIEMASNPFNLQYYSAIMTTTPIKYGNIIFMQQL